MHPSPRVTRIKDLGILGLIQFIVFAEPEQGFNGIQLFACLSPKRQFDPKSQVTAKSIDVTFVDPKLHGIDHRFSKSRVPKIELDDVIQALLDADKAAKLASTE